MPNRKRSDFRNYERELLKLPGVNLARRRIPVPKGCWMCGSSENKPSKEHIFPVWMLNYFDCKDELIGVAHVTAKGEVLNARENISFNKLTFGGVCARCNNGWMHDLENDFKYVYTEDWRTGQQVINPIVIARWFAKTATVLNISQQGRVKIPSRARHGLKSRKALPKGWHVYIFKCNTDDRVGHIDWQQMVQVISASLSGSSLERLSTIDKIYGCCIRVGDLVGVVFWHPKEVKDLDALAPMKRIWPDLRGEIDTLPWGGVLSNICSVRIAETEEEWSARTLENEKMRKEISKRLPF